jgi:bacterioferritin
MIGSGELPPDGWGPRPNGEGKPSRADILRWANTLTAIAANAVFHAQLACDVSRELVATSQELHQTLQELRYSAKLTGPYRRELRVLFQAEIGDEQGHAQFLADKIAVLGGEPTTEPRSVPHANQPREKLEHALAAEEEAIVDYNARIRQAEGIGDFGLKVDLENQVADETRHKEELERIIAGWDER